MKVYGRIDILVNNAAYISCGTIEELTPEETVNQFNTNLFGFIGVPAMGSYCASKWALERFSAALHGEVAPFGVKVPFVVPGCSCRCPRLFPNRFYGPCENFTLPRKFNEYGSVRTSAAKVLEFNNGNAPGDPTRGFKAIVDVVKGDREWPRRLVLGSDAVRNVSGPCNSVIQEIKEWEDVSRSCGFPKDI
ncbi:hypothetical protein RUND412_009142 [Rhizina undulata]